MNNINFKYQKYLFYYLISQLEFQIIERIIIEKVKNFLKGYT
jgi:hypothetical protein